MLFFQFIVARLKSVWTYKRVIVAFVVTLVATLGSYIAIVTFVPHFAVEPTEPLDPTNPFSVPFSVTNTGSATAKDVAYMCFVNKAVLADGKRVDMEDLYSRPKYWKYKRVGEIDPEEKLELPCGDFSGDFSLVTGETIKFRSIRIRKADISLYLTYRGAWRPRHRTEEFRFAASRGPNDEFRWLAQPDSAEYFRRF